MKQFPVGYALILTEPQWVNIELYPPNQQMKNKI